MTNTELLESYIQKSGKKKKYLAEKVGLSQPGFRNACLNKAEFTARQIAILCEELHIKTYEEMLAVFFAKFGA